MKESSVLLDLDPENEQVKSAEKALNCLCYVQQCVCVCLEMHG